MTTPNASIRPLTTALIVSSPELNSEVRQAVRGVPIRIILDQPTTIETFQLKRIRVDLVIVAGAPVDETMPDLVKRIKVVSPHTAIALVERSPRPETILDSMRNGADEFVLPPFDINLPEALLRIVAKHINREDVAEHPSKVVGFLSAKGGCGATMAACHVAVELARTTGLEVLLADFDLEAGMIGYLMKAKTQYSIIDAVKNLHRLDMSLWQGLVSKERPHLDVIPAPDEMPPQERYDTEQVRETFRTMRAMYGWVVADLGRGLGPISAALLDDLDALFVLSTLNLPALYQAKRFADRIRTHGYPMQRVHLIVNRVPHKSELSPEDCSKMLGLPLFGQLPESTDLDRAYGEGKLLTASSALGKELASFAMRMAGTKAEEPAKEKSRRSLFGSFKPAPANLGIK
jgi:pilus assembly protein CpaE